MGARCEQVVSLRIIRDAPRGPGADFDPDLVTAVLGLQPTTSWRVGDPFTAGRLHQRAEWEFALTREETYDTEQLVVRLMEQVGPIHPLLRQLREAHGLSTGVQVMIGIFSDGEGRDQVTPTPALSFDAGTIARLASLGLWMDIDQYVR